MTDEEGVPGKPGINEIQRKPKNPRAAKRSSPAYRGLKHGWGRHTLIIRETFFHKIKDVAYWERKDLKEVVDEALEAYLKDKDNKGRPPEKR